MFCSLLVIYCYQCTVVTDSLCMCVCLYSVVIIKRVPVVEADKTISDQLVFTIISDGSPYEALHSIFIDAVAPYFKSFLGVTGEADR